MFTKIVRKRLGGMLFIFPFAILLLGCNLPVAPAAQAPEADLVATAIQNTLIAQTLQALVANPPAGQPQDQGQPQGQPQDQVQSPTPTLTFTPSLTPEPTYTATSTVPMVSVSVDTNCRFGPGKDFELLGALLVGEQTEIIARDPSGYYWYVRNPDRPGGFCWLWGNYASTTGNIASLPVFTPPATLTPTATFTPQPDFTVAYNDVEMCGAVWHIDFRITNTGSLTFQSVATTVTDTVTSETVNYNNDEFREYNACVLNLATLQDDLAPTEVGFSTSESLSNDPSGHQINATITLCTQNGLAGTCITRNLSFTP
ncbi:MAG: hypothetical protein FJ010_13680 [Chloroflexi bacterium]|nr:hypothetical protein [Chloroflexota bacterium]